MCECDQSESEKSADEVEWDCQYCGDSFNTIRSLKIHEKMMHTNSSSKLSQTNSNSSSSSDQNQNKSDKEILLEIELEKMFEVSDETNFDKTRTDHPKLDAISKIDENFNLIHGVRQEMDQEMDLEMDQGMDQGMGQEMDQEPKYCENNIEVVEEIPGIKKFFSQLIKNELAKGIISFDLDLNELKTIRFQPNVVLSKSDCIDKIAFKIQKPKQSLGKLSSMGKKENIYDFSRKAEDIVNESLAISTVESHKCSNCVRSFESSKGLLQHISAVHEGKEPYPCTKCGETFKWASDYLRHNRLVHIQAKINSLNAILGLEAVKWS